MRTMTSMIGSLCMLALLWGTSAMAGVPSSAKVNRLLKKARKACSEGAKKLSSCNSVAFGKAKGLRAKAMIKACKRKIKRNRKRCKKLKGQLKSIVSTCKKTCKKASKKLSTCNSVAFGKAKGLRAKAMIKACKRKLKRAKKQCSLCNSYLPRIKALL